MSNKAAYKTICEQQKVPLFLQPWWLDAVCNGWDVAIARKGDMVTGVWPYAIDKKIGVTILRNPRLTPYLGPVVFFPADIKESNADSFEHETINDLVKQIPEAKVWDLALLPGMKQTGIFKNNNLQAVAHQTFLLNLTVPEEQLLSNIKESGRRNIRQAEKEIEITSNVAHLKDLYNFQTSTLANKGTFLPSSLAQLQQLMDACIANNAAKLWVAKSGNAVQAIVWQVWDKNCSYYLMGGQNQEAGSNKAMTALLWQAIRYAKQLGHSTFDFEGSMDEGVERFFRSFGGQRALYLVLHRNDSLLWKMKKMIR
ncbi:MAG: family N-acetyltransferase [Flavipsychrobacter sp.]|nr:family N-acetyltransferase [Flavipsychrobacter sp.]